MFRLFYYVVLMMLKRKFLVSSVIVFGSGVCYDAVSDRHEQQNQYELQYRFHFVANIRELFFLVQPFPANLEYLLNSVRFLCVFIKKASLFVVFLSIKPRRCGSGRSRTGKACLVLCGDGRISTNHYIHCLMRCMASVQSSRLPKAVRRRYPSPLGPKPTPGVPTTFTS